MDPERKRTILERLAHRRDVFVKSTQRGEADPTHEEKVAQLEELLDRRPGLFLQRFGGFLQFDDLESFRPLEGDEEVRYALFDLQRQLDPRTSKTRAKNRRLIHMQRLIREGSYFSDAAMKERNPQLFDEMIGRNLNEKERLDLSNAEARRNGLGEGSTLTQFLLGEHDRACLRQQQEDEFEEEFDTDSDEYEDQMKEGDMNEEPRNRKPPADEDLGEEEPPPVSDEVKAEMRSEFERFMKEEFLSGRDKGFDYRAVDDDWTLDDSEEANRDAEDRYFDED
eukprot:comp7346_c0_seq1/m.3046 comp7346_c0_seq1/g.3046  ORF comp7346_c0_seq1/g.3046 comp7346_c0_seq1/m.3046 type:complete len:281 (-) comp7346_c0_seq1:411-1253(-)